MSTRNRHRPALGIVELAVDPADVDEERYPVRIRLTRPLTPFEADRLAAAAPPGPDEGGGPRGAPARRAEGAPPPHEGWQLDDVARDHESWLKRLERVESLAAEHDGEAMVADQRRLDEQLRHGSHLRSQHVDNIGLH